MDAKFRTFSTFRFTVTDKKLLDSERKKKQKQTKREQLTSVCGYLLFHMKKIRPWAAVFFFFFFSIADYKYF